MKVLINDGLHTSGLALLKQHGLELFEVKVADNQLANYINQNKIETLLVRGATMVSDTTLSQSQYLKVIGRAGVGLDNIDLKAAHSKGIKVINTPNASSRSVAELVFAHLLCGMRWLHEANRNMPLEGDINFLGLKKSYHQAMELQGKTLGIIGFGKIGQETAKIGLGMGMNIQYHDPHHEQVSLELVFSGGQSVNFDLKSAPMDSLLKNADVISLHTPAAQGYLIGKKELDLMKPKAGIINTARGGLIDEVALLESLNKGHLSFAGLDVFENEPKPEVQLLMHPRISLSPHIGGSTLEAQERIGIELAQAIIALL